MGGQISTRLENGALAKLKVALKSLDELPPRDQHHLYGCHIKITDFLSIPGVLKEEVITHKYVGWSAIRL